MNTQTSFVVERPSPKLKELKETPTHRIYLLGPSAASTLELLGAILGNPDTALALLSHFPTLGDVARATKFDLESVPGIGHGGVARIKAAFELGRRLLVSSDGDRPTITSPADAANLLMGEMSLMEQECMRVILLDTRNRVLDIKTIYQGSLNTTMVRVAELFREAIRGNCAAIIVAHNHPSGDPSPSPEDVAITKDVVAAGKLLSVDVLDHLVIGGQGRFVSLKERGLGFA
jgi:DNA repair protein RadC